MTGDDQLSTSFHVLHRQECTSVPHPEGRAELGPGSCHQARPLPFWLVCLHVPFFLCSASRMPQGSWTSTSPSCPTHHRSSAPCICYWWLLVSDSKSLVFAYSATNGSGPSYIRDMVKPYTPSHPLLSMTAIGEVIYTHKQTSSHDAETLVSSSSVVVRLYSSTLCSSFSRKSWKEGTHASDTHHYEDTPEHTHTHTHRSDTHSATHAEFLVQTNSGETNTPPTHTLA